MKFLDVIMTYSTWKHSSRSTHRHRRMQGRHRLAILELAIRVAFHLTSSFSRHLTRINS